jgi:methylenetetrahydrofolate reductase (NADPH)
MKKGKREMKIKDILGQGRPTLSFEVFPPKTEDNYETVEKAAREIAGLRPAFMSVTYGAGGGTSRYTVDIAAALNNEYHVPTLAHLTCVSSSREKVHQVLKELEEKGIENVLALRGDIPKDGRTAHDYRYASELIREIKEKGDFCIGAACYPEGHVESANKTADIGYLKEKVEAGCDFVTTQMFFDNNILYNYLYRVREKGITVPVVAGIMPVTNVSQIKRICQMSGTYLPSRFKAIVDRFGDRPAAMKQAGIAYATEQIIDLIANGINGIHIYSMNKPDVAARIQESLSEIIEQA